MTETQHKQKDSSTSQSNAEEPEGETLYCALLNVGVCNITTLSKRLELQSSADESKPPSEKVAEVAADIKEPDSIDDRVRKNSIQLLKLMGLSEASECACLLEKICVQGKEMLGEISKPTIASASIVLQTKLDNAQS